MWASAAANMATYLMLKERAEAYRADPEVQAALEASGVADAAAADAREGESFADLLADRSAFEDFDADARRPSTASASSGSTSWPSSTCWAPADACPVCGTSPWIADPAEQNFR